MRLRMLAAVLLATACDDSLDRPSELRSLRALAVRADAPFAPPGSSTRLEVALVDAAPGAVRGGVARPVQVAWLGGCDNPADDSHVACAPALRRAAALLSDADLAAGQVPAGASGRVGFGLSFEAQLSPTLISDHPATGSPVPYGLSFVYFAACGGRLRRAPADAAFPLECVDEAGQPLGADDFVTGYYPLWSYDQLRNANPVAAPGLLLTVPPSGRACDAAAPCPEGEACGAAGLCLRSVAGCAEDGADSCPPIEVKPRVDRASVEPGQSASVVGADAPPENLWVSYFSPRGRLDADARFVNDGDLGWIDDHGTAWRAPAAPGEVRLWAVVRDSRGGVVWVFQDVVVR